MEDLLHLALIAKDLEMARKIQSHIPDGFLHNLEDVEFQMYLLAHSEPYEKLETRCRTALECETKDQTNSHPLLDLCTSFENIYSDEMRQQVVHGCLG